MTQLRMVVAASVVDMNIPTAIVQFALDLLAGNRVPADSAA
jgi:hypothetical protein